MCYLIPDRTRYFCKNLASMEINRPINRRKALKVLGLGMLATCMPTLPACGNAKNEKKIKRLIFYFSATGNSLYVSRQIAGEEAPC